jgi:hypothetical protein
MERGTRKVTAEEALALAGAMGVRIGTLVGEPEPQAESADLRFEVSVRLLPSSKEAHPVMPPELRKLLHAVKSQGSAETKDAARDLLQAFAQEEQVIAPRSGRTRAHTEERQGKK